MLTPDYKDLPDAYQVAALRGMLTGKYRDHIDMKLAERDMQKDELLGEIRRYAVLKRQQRKSPDAMDVDAVTRRRRGNPDNAHALHSRGEWPWIQACSGDEEWGNAWGYEEEDDWGQIEEVGKGKGKGKGKAFRGECYTCGEWGHSTRNCPTLGKGFSGACYNCGIVGHSAKYCPSPPRKGSKGKGKGKGKNGKGAWIKGKGSTRSVEYDDEEGEVEEEDEGEGNDIGGIWQIAGNRGTTRWGWSSCQRGKSQCEKRANRRRGSENTWEVLRIHDDEGSEQGEVLHMGHGEEGWEEVNITVDSGAVDTVGPRTLGKGHSTGGDRSFKAREMLPSRQ